MLTNNHPKTILFMKIVKILCNILNINFFTKQKYKEFLKNQNYMELP